MMIATLSILFFVVCSTDELDLRASRNSPEFLLSILPKEMEVYGGLKVNLGSFDKSSTELNFVNIGYLLALEPFSSSSKSARTLFSKVDKCIFATTDHRVPANRLGMMSCKMGGFLILEKPLDSSVTQLLDSVEKIQSIQNFDAWKYATSDKFECFLVRLSPTVIAWSTYEEFLNDVCKNFNLPPEKNEPNLTDIMPGGAVWKEVDIEADFWAIRLFNTSSNCEKDPTLPSQPAGFRVVPYDNEAVGEIISLRIPSPTTSISLRARYYSRNDDLKRIAELRWKTEPFENGSLTFESNCAVFSADVSLLNSNNSHAACFTILTYMGRAVFL